GDGETKVVFQPFAHDDFVGVVVAEGEFVGGIRAFVLDLRDTLEEVGHVRSLIADWAARKRACPASKASLSDGSGSTTRAMGGSVAISAPAPVAAIRPRRAAP